MKKQFFLKKLQIVGLNKENQMIFLSLDSLKAAPAGRHHKCPTG